MGSACTRDQRLYSNSVQMCDPDENHPRIPITLDYLVKRTTKTRIDRQEHSSSAHDSGTNNSSASTLRQSMLVDFKLKHAKASARFSGMTRWLNNIIEYDVDAVGEQDRAEYVKRLDPKVCHTISLRSVAERHRRVEREEKLKQQQKALLTAQEAHMTESMPKPTFVSP
eukprot:Tbor_TRINITY_DN6170_c0_g2::TRINITY_DN6170_c0_g2_i1::g.22295::m.22295